MRPPITRTHHTVTVSTIHVTVTNVVTANYPAGKRAAIPTVRHLHARQYSNTTSDSPDSMAAFSSALSSGCSCLDIPVTTFTRTLSATPYVCLLARFCRIRLMRSDHYPDSPILCRSLHHLDILGHSHYYPNDSFNLVPVTNTECIVSSHERLKLHDKWSQLCAGM